MIKVATKEDIADWLRLREKLWPPTATDDFQQEIMHILKDTDQQAFLFYNESMCIGFIEMSIRNFADGCVTDHVAYVEGIYVEPEFRQQQVARKLLKAGEQWAKEKGCTEMASDVEMGNDPSIAFHLSAGFNEVTRAVLFAKKLE